METVWVYDIFGITVKRPQNRACNWSGIEGKNENDESTNFPSLKNFWKNIYISFFILKEPLGIWSFSTHYFNMIESL